MMNLPSVQQSELQEHQQNLQNLQFAGVQQPINLGYAQQTVPITMPTTFQQPILSSSFAAPIVQQQLPIMQQASWVQQQQLPISLGYAQQQPINLAYTQQQPIMQQQFPINLQASGFEQQQQLQMPVMQSAVSTVMPAYGGQSALGFLSPLLFLSRWAGCLPFLPSHPCCTR